MNLRFDQPAMLYLALLAIPLILIGWRAMSAMDPLRRTTAVVLRALLLIAIALVLANPRIDREHDDLTVIGLIDVSGSVRRFADVPEHPELGRLSSVEYVRRWFRSATEARRPDDRPGLAVGWLRRRNGRTSRASTVDRDADLQRRPRRDLATRRHRLP